MSRGTVRSGFTLIEMLVVIAIILVLSGIVLRATSLVLRHTATGRSQHDLQQLQNALNEYYAEYGNYPPCTEVPYEYEGWMTRMIPALRTILDGEASPQFNNPELSGFIADMERPGGWPQCDPGRAIGYRYGLVAYLYPRDRGQTHWYDRDTERDKAAKARWSNFLRDVNLVKDNPGGCRKMSLGAEMLFTNLVDTIQDAWRNDYQYISKAPYQSYKLWSKGPDGASGTADDINGDSKFSQ